MDFLVDAFNHLDFNAELSFDVSKVIALFSSVFEVLGRKFFPWTDDMVERSWVEIHGEHDDVCIRHKVLKMIYANIWSSGPSLRWRYFSFLA